jgi:hypothetical protein
MFLSGGSMLGVELRRGVFGLASSKVTFCIAHAKEGQRLLSKIFLCRGGEIAFRMILAGVTRCLDLGASDRSADLLWRRAVYLWSPWSVAV